ncbi:hypothetical protein EDB83DRAFT_2322362 [Lactarius deliciosus]|nr:hypothetical protein EDB83DRAFT_2322362 [Lactarius deliciosus]
MSGARAENSDPCLGTVQALPESQFGLDRPKEHQLLYSATPVAASPRYWYTTKSTRRWRMVDGGFKSRGGTQRVDILYTHVSVRFPSGSALRLRLERRGGQTPEIWGSRRPRELEAGRLPLGEHLAEPGCRASSPPHSVILYSYTRDRTSFLLFGFRQRNGSVCARLQSACGDGGKLHGNDVILKSVTLIHRASSDGEACLFCQALAFIVDVR